MRTTSIVLNSLVKANVSDAPVRQMVRWMMAARKDGRWGNTQENALAMEALVAYYRKFESAPPDFRAVVKLGTEDFAREEFKGRTTTSKTKELPMSKVLAQGPGGTARPLTFTREGTGTLFYTARLRYVSDLLFLEGLDNGFQIARSYAPYVETGTRPAATTYKAGDLVRVTLTFNLTKERRFVAVTDPLPAGFEAVESWFATTAALLSREPGRSGRSRHDLVLVVGARRLRSRRTPRRPRPALRHAPQRRPARVHATSSAPRPPARSGPRQRAPKRCIRPRSSGGRRRR